VPGVLSNQVRIGDGQQVIAALLSITQDAWLLRVKGLARFVESAVCFSGKTKMVWCY
jgi:hypothetical protein